MKIINDILLDVYPVGINTYHCTEYSGVCGCDNCIGNISLDIPKRTQAYMEDLDLIGRRLTVKWMVLQAFYDQNSWWERAPTSQEIRAMWYISIIYGYKVSFSRKLSSNFIVGFLVNVKYIYRGSCFGVFLLFLNRQLEIKLPI